MFLSYLRIHPSIKQHAQIFEPVLLWKHHTIVRERILQRRDRLLTIKINHENKQLEKQELRNKRSTSGSCQPQTPGKHTHNPIHQAQQHKLAEHRKSSVAGDAANLTPYPYLSESFKGRILHCGFGHLQWNHSHFMCAAQEQHKELCIFFLGTSLHPSYMERVAPSLTLT
jgi:hypothetical protein